MNLHFMNTHLQDFYIQVYKRSKLKQGITNQSHKTPLRKLTKSSRRIKQIIKCPKCDYQTGITSRLAKHMKKEHGDIKLETLCVENPGSDANQTDSPKNNGEHKDTPAIIKIDIEIDCESDKVIKPIVDEEYQLTKSLCMLCGAGFCSELEVNNHIESMHETKCDVCGKFLL